MMLEVVPLLLMPALLLYIFLYLVAYLLNKESMKKSAEAELWEWIVNVVLFALIYTLAFSPTAEESVATSVFDKSLYLLSQRWWESTTPLPDSEVKPMWVRGEEFFSSNASALWNLSLSLMANYTHVGLLRKSFGLQLTTPSQRVGDVSTSSSTSLAPCSSYDLIQQRLKEIHSYVIGTYQSFLNLYYFLKQMALEGTMALYLIVGFFFRSFRITRPIGGFLIAVALATAFVLPFSYLLLDALYAHYFGSGVVGHAVELFYGTTSSPGLAAQVPGRCDAYTSPSAVAIALGNFYSAFYSSDFLTASYAALLSFAFAWLLYFSAIMSIMNILGARVSPFILNILFRV